MACPAGSSFDNTTRQCIQCEGGLIYNPDSKKCECPNSSFWSGEKCITCYLPQYFDMDAKVCRDCPAGQYFDREKRYCVAQNP